MSCFVPILHSRHLVSLLISCVVLCCGCCQVIGQLTPTEKELMVKKLEELEASLLPGFNILNWNSLGIMEFIQVWGAGGHQGERSHKGFK